jgi:hypothetical protein
MVALSKERWEFLGGFNGRIRREIYLDVTDFNENRRSLVHITYSYLFSNEPA